MLVLRELDSPKGKIQDLPRHKFLTSQVGVPSVVTSYHVALLLGPTHLHHFSIFSLLFLMLTWFFFSFFFFFRTPVLVGNCKLSLCFLFFFILINSQIMIREVSKTPSSCLARSLKNSRKMVVWKGSKRGT